MVLSSEGYFYLYSIDLEKGGECMLMKQYKYVFSLSFCLLFFLFVCGCKITTLICLVRLVYSIRATRARGWRIRTVDEGRR